MLARADALTACQVIVAASVGCVGANTPPKLLHDTPIEEAFNGTSNGAQRERGSARICDHLPARCAAIHLPSFDLSWPSATCERRTWTAARTYDWSTTQTSQPFVNSLRPPTSSSGRPSASSSVPRYRARGCSLITELGSTKKNEELGRGESDAPHAAAGATFNLNQRLHWSSLYAGLHP